MTERDKKYHDFVEFDTRYNLGRLVNACDELRFCLSHPDINQIIAKRNLNDILSYAIYYSPFYKEYDGFSSYKDFPIMTKHDLKEHFNEISVPQVSMREDLCTKYTSGSTGTPFKMIMDKYKHARWIAGNKVFRENVGVRSHEKTVFISDTILDKNIPMERQERDNVYYRSQPYLDEASLKELIDYLAESKTVTLTAMASVYDKIAQLIREGKAPKWRGEFIAAFSVSETLKETTRHIISDYFGCPVYVFFANEENGVLGVEDGSENGCRANNVDFFLEVLKLERDEPVEEGEIGRLVITDYFNKAFPIIRYENGDLVSVKRLPDGRLYITEILGRLVDTLYTTDGRMVHYFDGISFMEQFLDIRQFQLIQDDFHHFRWILNTNNHTYENTIIETCKSLFGEDSVWSFFYVDEIPKLQSGKQRMTVCNIADVK